MKKTEGMLRRSDTTFDNISEKAERAFAELYVNRYMEDRKADRSTIACEAIVALHKKEKGNKDESLAQS